MGEFLSYVARTLDLVENQFVQTNEIFMFGTPRATSWLAIPQGTPRDPLWFTVAAGTLRIHVGDETPYISRNTVTGVVMTRPPNRLIYIDDWTGSAYSGLIHLALPPGFLADVPTLFRSSSPSYAVINGGRVCIGWTYTVNIQSRFTFDLISPGDNDFDVASAIFIDRFDAALRREPETSQLRHIDSLLNTHRHNLTVYEQQAATLGTYTPPHVLVGIDQERKAIQQYEAELKKWRST